MRTFIRPLFFVHDLDAVRAADAVGAGVKHIKDIFLRVDSTGGFDADERSHGLAHKGDIRSFRTAFAKSRRGFDEISSAFDESLARLDDFGFGEIAVLKNDFESDALAD